MNNWQIGDRALIVNCPWWHHCGEIATLVKPHPSRPNRWEIDLPPAPSCTICVCPEKHLAPIPDDFSRYHNELAEKGPCEYDWRPKVTV